MLELKDIKKTYVVGDIETKALDGISVAFREREFVSILGMSGSGKTTCLNMIGGLDRYDSGDMVIKGKRTADFKDKDWDAYRNNSVGFVFQSYNLIMHLGIVANVELAMTLSGISASEKRKRALEVLTRVGLKDHLHKKPNQLSGGQMQRVAIARALANNPEILLCDEPTGALDTTTSTQIMELIKELSKDRLVIMVTHNPELAEKYSDRIINFQDGKIINDTHPHIERPKSDQFSLTKTSMSFLTALRLSANNLRTKKGRTFLTAFASSIGIIGIAVILSLSAGFQEQVNEFQRTALAEFPIIISQNTSEMDADAMQSIDERRQRGLRNPDNTDTETVYLYDPSSSRIMHTNVFTDEFLEHLNNIDPEYCSSIGFTRIVSMNMLRDTEDGIKQVSFDDMMTSMAGGSGMMGNMANMSSMGLSSYPVQLDSGSETYIEKYYDLLSGEYPKEPTDIVLIIDDSHSIDYRVLANLGFNAENNANIKFSDIVDTEIKIISNDNFYVKTEFGTFLPGTDYQAMYDADGNISARICGIVKLKEDTSISLLSLGFSYSDALSQLVIDNAIESEIVQAQKESDVNVMTLAALDEVSKNSFIAYLGGDPKPFMIMVYPHDFYSKDQVTAYLDEFNENREFKDRVFYTDLAATVSSLTGNIMDAITVVLIAFAAISLIVSLIMISIITYTSVIERTKEIGILKALGARKKDVTRVFDAETCILGIFSGVLGVTVAWLLTFPTNAIIYNLTELKDVAHLPLLYAIMLVIISTTLTMLGGHIPARMASKKDPVEALRSE